MTLEISVRDDILVADKFGELLNLVKNLILKTLKDDTNTKKNNVAKNDANRAPPALGVRVRDNFYTRESYGR
jgi:hypothetical protein